MSKHHKYIMLLVLIAVFSAYSNTFHSPPTLDDFHSFIDEPLIKNNALSIENLMKLTQSKFGLSRWIPMMTFSIDISRGQGSVVTLHVTNLLIHLLTTLSVYFLIRRLCECAQDPAETAESLPPTPDLALWVAALWALNPVQTNAVTYLVQRMASLVTLFSVLCVALYVSGRLLSIRRGEKLRGAPLLYGFGSLGCMILACLSKENALILPLLLLCTEAWFFQRSLFSRLWSFLVQRRMLMGGMILGSIMAAAMVLPGIIDGYNGRHFTLGERLLTETRIVVWYISLFLWPLPGRMSLEHDVQVSTSILSPISTLFAIAVLMGLLGFAIFRRREYPLVTYGLFWFFLNISMESTIIPLELIFEHRLYFPSVGLVLAVTVLLHTWFTRAAAPRLQARECAIISWCIVALAGSCLSLLTFERNRAWADQLTLNGDNVLKAPNHPRAHCNLAVAHSTAGQYEAAIREAEASIQLGKKNFESYAEAANTIIISLKGLGEHERAIEEGERLIRERPEDAAATALPLMHLNLVSAHKALGDVKAGYQNIVKALITNKHLSWMQPSVALAAENLLRVLLSLPESERADLNGDGMPDPGDTPTDTWIAALFYNLDYRADARRMLDKSMRQGTSDPAAASLAEALQREDELNRIQAEKWSFFRKYVQRPSSVFNLCMASAYLVREKRLPSPFMKIGESLLEYAMRLDPGSADALLLKGWYHYERDEASEAVRRAKAAIELEPDSAKAWLGLGFFLVKANRPEEALTAFKTTLDLYPAYPQRVAIIDISSSLIQTIQGQESVPKGTGSEMGVKGAAAGPSPMPS